MKQPICKQSQRTRINRPRRTRQIPREFDALLNQFARDPQKRVEFWWYGLVFLMLDQKQVVRTGQRQVAERTWVTLCLDGGNEFEIVRPPMTEEMEAQLREGVRAILAARRAR